MQKVRVFDIEANGLTPDKIHCMVFSSLDEKQIDKFKPDEMDKAVRFLDSCDVIIGHNILSYDLPVIKKILGYEFKGKKVDTLLMSRLQCPNRQPPMNARGDAKAMRSPHGLGCWGYRVGRGKPEHEDWETYSEEMLHRCSEDVGINIAVYEALMEEGKGTKWRSAHMLTFKLFENLQKQEEAGWLLDQEHIHKALHMIEHWTRRIDRLLEPTLPYICKTLEKKVKGSEDLNYVRKVYLKGSGGYTESVLKHYGDDAHLVVAPFSRIEVRKIKLGSDQEVKDFLLTQGWIPDAWNTDDDGNQTSPKLNKDTTFDGITGAGGKLIVLRSRINDRASIMRGYLANVREDGRLASIVSGLADTRRMKHKQIVNVPNADALLGPMMRKCFIAREGYKLVGCDAAGCQDRMLASRANDPELTRILLEGDKEKGTDAHTLVMKRVNVICDKYRVKHIKRGAGKNIGFGWKFGAGNPKLGRMIHSTKDAGGEIKEALRELFPAQARVMDELTAEWRKNAKRRMNRWNKMEYYDGWIHSIDGAKLFIASEHAVLVYTLQCDEAIFMSAAYNLAHRYLEKKYKWWDDYCIVNFNHDEFTTECREEIAEDVAQLVLKAYRDASDYFGFNVPQVGDASIGDNWYDIH
jgi:hypothetical protein